MTDISLRDYLQKLDTLLGKGSHGEVIHHSRHILQYFPKNAATYRILGRALFQAGSWQEAGEVFRRVLSVYPDDYTAHAGLSEVYLNLKRPDEAIWHLERAFEQDPNNRPILDNLRELYRKHRNVEHAKVQLTSGAVARQYLRNGLYEQAIETLQQALERSPERADLRLLLATTYREAGYRIESAEVAVEVLKVLPDCLEANQILTELWLAEQRPSDAQRYLNRIQSVEPYLALELAQGQDVPDDAFKLEELDYRRAAEREILTQSPDWLRDINQSAGTTASEPEAEPVDSSSTWMGSFAPKTGQTDELPNFDDAFSTELPADWLSDVDVAEEAPPTASRKRTGLTGLLSQFNEPEEPEIQDAGEPDIDDLFPDMEPVENALPDVEAAEDVLADVPDLFGELPPTEQPQLRQTGALKEADPLAWLHESGIEVVDEPQGISDDLFDAEDDLSGLQDADAANPMAWLQGYGGDEILTEEAAQEIRQPSPSLGEPPAEDDGDPLAWLNATDYQPMVEQPAQATPQTGDAEDVDPLDWLSDASLLDEALSLEELVESPSTTQTSSSAAPITDRQENMADERDDNLDWLGSADSESGDNDLPDWLTESAPAEATAASSPQADPDFPDWLSATPVQGEPEEEILSAIEDAPDWLNDMSPEPEAEAQFETEAEPADESGFQWMSDAQPDLPDTLEPAAAISTPDWLNDMSPEPEPEAETQFETEAEPADESGFQWMSDAQPDLPDTLEPAAAIDTPDWLNDMSPEPEAEAQFEAEAEPADDAGFQWMSDAQPDLPDTLEPAAVDTPDWLNDMSPEPEAEAQFEAEAEPADDAGFQWMSDAQPDLPDMLEPAAAIDTPDWLKDVSPNVEAGGEGQGDDLTLIEGIGAATETSLYNAGITTYAQIAQMSPDELYDAVKDTPVVVDSTESWPRQAQYLVDGDIQGFYSYQKHLVGGREPVEAEIPPHEDISDWNSQTETAASETELSSDADDSRFEWVSEEAAESDPEDAGMSDMPDWVTEMSPTSSSASEEADADDDAFEWISEETSDETPHIAISGDTPDWLSEVGSSDEDEEIEAAVTSGAEFEWISEETEEPAEAQADMPDWLTEMSPETSQSDMELEEIGDFAAVEESEFFSPTEASADTPAWLSEMQSDDEPEAEPEPEASSQFDWVNDLNNEQEEESPEPASADVPDWLDDESDSDETEFEAEPAVDMPDWLSDAKPTTVQTTDTVEPEESTYTWEGHTGELGEQDVEPIEVVPDWLNHIQSQQADSTPEVVNETASNEFSWIEDINSPVESDEAEAEPTFELSDDAAETFDYDEVDTFEPDEFVSEEAPPTAPVPANNAPDWLNAMVPGLDVDYDAAEDTQIEESFIEETSSVASVRAEQVTPIRNKREFEWLSNIVEEETQQFSPIQDTGKKRRFVFSRQPAWLRKPTEPRDTSTGTETRTVANNDFDFDDIDNDEVDLPPWLQ